MLRPLILLALALPCYGQISLSFAPQPRSVAAAALLGPETTVWVVTACAPPGTTVPAGRIYQSFETRGYSHISRQLAGSLTVRRQSRSLPSKIAKYAGYAAAGGAYLLSVKVINASPQWQQGMTAAAGFLGFIVPLAQREVPAPDPAVAAGLLNLGLAIDATGCAEGTILAVRARDERSFQIQIN